MPKKTDASYARWKLVEQQRRWKIENDANPIVLIPMSDRVMPLTYSLEEAYWHPITCDCGSCQGRKAVKQVRMGERPVPPAVRSVGSPLPPLSDQTLHRLRAVESEALLTPDSLTS